MPLRSWIVMGSGLVLSLLLYSTLREWERTAIEQKVADLTRNQIDRLQVNMLRSMEVLHSIAAFHAVRDHVDRTEFSQFVRSALARQPELQALSWNPMIWSGEREAFESKAKSDGLTDYRILQKRADSSLISAETRDFYVPVHLIEPLEGNRVAVGYDLNSDQRRRTSLAQARDRRQAVATAPVKLAQGPEDQIGFLVVLPVYREGVEISTIVGRWESLKGFAVAVFRVHDLVGQAFEDLRRRGVTVELFDESPDGEFLYRSAAVPAKGSSSRLASLEVAGRRWVVRFAPTNEFLSAQSSVQSRLVLLGGLMFTLLTTGYVYGGWRRTQQVTKANMALQNEVVVRKKAEAAAAAANEAKSDFLASMSHEIRTPLNAILGYAQIIQRDTKLLPEQRDAIAGIRVSGHHLLGLINEILDLSKIEAGRMDLRPVDFDLYDLANGLTATFRPLCAQKKIGFRLLIEPGIRTTMVGDEGKLRQVLINLVGNAVKFTDLGEVYIRFQPQAENQWLFEVIDTGLGIPAEEHGRMFEPFHQGSGARHHGGTGLGLAIARRLVELMGGRLEFQSERGVGSRFFFSIPLLRSTCELPQHTGDMLRLSHGVRVRALVVDDNEANREVMTGMLSAAGCEVCSAEDGARAVALATEIKPDVIFLDWRLPGKLTGVETARAILTKASSNTLKIIAHSASTLPQHRDEALKVGCVDFIVKPFLAERLYESLQEHLDVVFEIAELSPDESSCEPVNPQRVLVPEALLSRLTLAAELHSTTALKSCLSDLRELGPEAQSLAEQIRQLMRSYDMDGVQRLLSSMSPAVQ